jgi:hypothetical protein
MALAYDSSNEVHISAKFVSMLFLKIFVLSKKREKAKNRRKFDFCNFNLSRQSAPKSKVSKRVEKGVLDHFRKK